MSTEPSSGASLLRGAAHLLRTPLGVVLGMAATLRDYDERFTSEQRAVYLGEIALAAEEMRDALDGMSLLSRLISGTLSFEPVQTSMADALTEAASGLDSVWGTGTVQVVEPESTSDVAVDPLRLRQAFSSLARAYGPGEGTCLSSAGGEVCIGPLDAPLSPDEANTVLTAPLEVAAAAEAVARPAGWSLLLARLLLRGQNAHLSFDSAGVTATIAVSDVP